MKSEHKDMLNDLMSETIMGALSEDLELTTAKQKKEAIDYLIKLLGREARLVEDDDCNFDLDSLSS